MRPRSKKETLRLDAEHEKTQAERKALTDQTFEVVTGFKRFMGAITDTNPFPYRDRWDKDPIYPEISEAKVIVKRIGADEVSTEYPHAGIIEARLRAFKQGPYRHYDISPESLSYIDYRSAKGFRVSFVYFPEQPNLPRTTIQENFYYEGCRAERLTLGGIAFASLQELPTSGAPGEDTLETAVAVIRDAAKGDLKVLIEAARDPKLIGEEIAARANSYY